MIELHEGIVRKVNTPLSAQDPIYTLNVEDPSSSFEIPNVELHVLNSTQIIPEVGSKILFYRTSSSDAKFITQLSDPLPVASPLPRDAAEADIESGETTFEPGDVALQALGVRDSFFPQDGGCLWLRNNGDAVVSSGNQIQRITCSDSSDAIEVYGKTIDIESVGNVVNTHGIRLNNSELGATSLELGQKLTFTGQFVNALKIGFTGNVSLGTHDPVLGNLLTGISYNITPTPTAVAVPEIQLTSVPITSTLTVNSLGTSVVGPAINLTSPVTIDLTTIELSLLGESIRIGGPGTGFEPAVLIDMSAADATITGVTSLEMVSARMIIPAAVGFVPGVSPAPPASVGTLSTLWVQPPKPDTGPALAAQQAYTGTFTINLGAQTVYVTNGIIVAVV